ncbi:MAG: type II toxin-antitoxin system RelE/ParE family toxin [Thermodesulfovibrionales bacterium]|nr:type II toxin-antitoxin system RelE/ParE family toxin [Thermodesulfovibrionales bacterium]
MFKIVITDRALKDIDKLTQDVKKRIASKLREFSNNPLDYSRKLTDPKIGTYRFRIGDYRVIFDIEGETIIVLRIGHRKDIYK